MAKIIQGGLRPPRKKIACIVSRFNEEITGNLLQGALLVLKRAGVPDKNVDVYKVPGAFEVPFALKRVLATGKYEGAIILSAIVKGDTDHDQYVARAITEGASQLQLEFNRPISCGVITARTWRQALERSGGRMGNRGADAAQTCLEMMDLAQKIKK